MSFRMEEFHWQGRMGVSGKRKNSRQTRAIFRQNAHSPSYQTLIPRRAGVRARAPSLSQNSVGKSASHAAHETKGKIPSFMNATKLRCSPRNRKTAMLRNTHGLQGLNNRNGPSVSSQITAKQMAFKTDSGIVSRAMGARNVAN
jgi:hypothetical protein